MAIKYSVIYADPPWSFQSWTHRGEGKGASQHYDCMSVAELCDLRIEGVPVADLAAHDAALFLWVVQPMLPEALQVISAWGFTYRTVAFVWVKMPALWNADQFSFFEGTTRLDPRMGLGYHTRSGSEQCWLAIRGKGYQRESQDIEQVLHAPIREHSRKPDEIASRIERLVGSARKIELFARTRRAGWSVWGMECNKYDVSNRKAV